MFLLLCFYLYLYKRNNMGRKRIYETEKDQLDARKKRQKEYYKRNKDLIKIKRMKRYWKDKNYDR